ncbi:N-acetylmuramoyl-L-alanine amidase family protein [Phenylobacterium sp.]|jgi:N-acetylmuramoyl-L-alanine amidase|uniref:N-acetylmuramoyl-L-alanine amidase family protein n=1 Tax=Phenylobacterium sp. TaxID=1871053 RepID=UPI0039C91762
MLAGLSDVIRGAKFRFAAIAAGGLVCLGAFAVSHAATTHADVLKIRLGGDRTATRIVIDLNASATGKLAADGAADRRVVVNLAGVSAGSGQQGGGQGLVKAWMLDEASGGARLRLDLAADAVIKRRFLLPPADGIGAYRYVIDLAAAGPAPALGRAAPLQAFPGGLNPASALRLTSRPLPSRAAPLSLKKVVVIDAGHGGRDPGAHGAQGVEKDVTLAAARALKARLENSGRYRVVLTRQSDVYVPLETRVQIARRADADLFISLHADAGSDPNLRGASVYTLSEKASSRAAKFVNKDDWFMKANMAGDSGVSDILLDLTQRATKNRSAAFAEGLLVRVERQTPLLRRSHRDAGLVVLLAPDVPAVLLEMGFITNSGDESALRDAGRRTRLMNAVGDAIDDYFARETRLAAR